MISVLSPAKTLDFETPCKDEYTLPRFPKQTNQLIDVLRTKKPEDIQALMNVSENIASLNVGRYQSFSARHNTKNGRTCGMAFRGDVYLGLEADKFSEDDMSFAQKHLRILSGLYGLLRPMDLIQAYRLEMGTKLAFDDYRTLYQYWQDKIASLLNRDLRKQGDNIIVNLASQEYFNAVDQNRLKGKIVHIEFKDFKIDRYKIISFYAKKARGMMSRYIIKNRINEVDALKAFDLGGYWYDDKESSDNKLAFKRG